MGQNKTGGHKLFKQGHTQTSIVNQQGFIFEIICSCLSEMKKDCI